MSTLNMIAHCAWYSHWVCIDRCSGLYVIEHCVELVVSLSSLYDYYHKGGGCFWCFHQLYNNCSLSPNAIWNILLCTVMMSGLRVWCHHFCSLLIFGAVRKWSIHYSFKSLDFFRMDILGMTASFNIKDEQLFFFQFIL